MSIDLKLEQQEDNLLSRWNRVSIGEICNLGGGTTPSKTNDDYWGGSIPWASPKDFEGVSLDQTEDNLTEYAVSENSINLYNSGDIAMVVRSGVLHHSLPVAQLSTEMAVNQDVKVLKPDIDRISTDYFLNILLYEADRIRASCAKTGTTVESIETAFLKGYKLPLPPLPEQQRIADILSTVDKQIQQTDEIIQETKELKRGLVQDLIFFGKSHNGTQTVQLGPMTTEITESWDIATVGEVTTKAQYGSSESLSTEGKYPVFRMNNIEDGRMVSSPMKYSDLDKEQAEKYRVGKGDILFNRTNSIDLVGKSGIFDLEGEYIFASYLIRLRTNEKMNPYFLNYYLNSYLGQGVLYSIATRGASQANINATNLKRVNVPLPPREQQDRIVNQIQKVEEKIEQEQETKRGLQELKRGLMQDLLTGKVRVNAD